MPSSVSVCIFTLALYFSNLGNLYIKEVHLQNVVTRGLLAHPSTLCLQLSFQVNDPVF